MKNLIITFLPLIFFAQSQRFTYQYKFVKDTLNKSEETSELMNLDVLPKFSKFYSYTSFQNDSLAKADYDRQTATTGSFQTKQEYNKGAVKYTVVKLKPENSIIYFQRIGTIKFKVKDYRKLDWRILPEKNKIDSYLCQKATVNFGGRNWTAWFAPEIAIQDGPYKFSGLPGLIVEMYDSTDSHHFKIIGSRKLSPKEILQITPDPIYIFDFGTPKDTDLQLFNNYILETRKDPNKSIRLSLGDISNIETDGKMMDVNEYLRNREAQMKEKMKHDNNLIEIDFLK